MELENGGNIKFEYSPNKADGWYKSCHDLLMSRFCASDFSAKSINGIKIKKVIRATNRVLVAKYEEKLLTDVDENDYINNKLAQLLLIKTKIKLSKFQRKIYLNRPSLRKKIDYLLYSWRPKLGSHKNELYDILKNGFYDPSYYKKFGYEEGIPFSNSLFVSDSNRIESSKATQNSRFSSNIAFKYGNIIF